MEYVERGCLRAVSALVLSKRVSKIAVLGVTINETHAIIEVELRGTGTGRLSIVNPLMLHKLRRLSRQILDDHVQRKAMTPTIKHGLLMDTAEGMDYLYNAGVEHRDLKSANCLVTHDWRIKVMTAGWLHL